MTTEVSKHTQRKVIDCMIAAEQAGYMIVRDLPIDLTQLRLLYDVVDWLRIDHNIIIWIEPGSEPFINYFAVVRKYIPHEKGGFYSLSDHSEKGFKDYVLALCDGIERGLKMITTANNKV